MSIFKRFSSKQSSGELPVNAPLESAPHSHHLHPAPVSPVVRARSNTDPDTCLQVYKSHWLRALCIINGKNSPARNTSAARQQTEDLEAVMRYFDQMNILLIEEDSVEGGQGPILEYLLAEDILGCLVAWGLSVPPISMEVPQRLRLYLLKIYELLVSEARQPMLLHKPVIRPLFKLLSTCSEENQMKLNVAVETRLILMLHQLCVCVTQDKQILELLFNATADHGSSGFLMFSLLIPYTHREGAIGQQARDALLLIMSLSYSHDDIGIYIADKSHFCPVLATGLSGLYSSLPRKMSYPSDDWYQLTFSEMNEMPDLVMFLNSLEFCNAVVQVAHPLVREKLLNFIYNGFLVPVLGPALHQNDIRYYDGLDLLLDDDADEANMENRFMDLLNLPISVLDSYYATSVEEVIAATAYTELFLRRVTEPALMRTFLTFILTDKFEEKNILESLIERINSNSRLCMVTLSLFQTLVDLNCEDVMFQLIFKFLVPCTHVMVSQRKAVRDVDLYGRAAEKLLSLTPTCCLLHVEDDLEATTSLRPNTSLVVSFDTPAPCPTPPSLPTSTEPKRRFSFGFRSRKQSNNNALLAISEQWAHNHDGSGNTVEGNASPDNASLCSMEARSLPHANTFLPTLTTSSPDSLSITSATSSVYMDQLRYESLYSEYLKVAHIKIEQCTQSCACWQHAYDGEDPPPDTPLSSVALLQPEKAESESSEEKVEAPVSPFDSVITSDADSALSLSSSINGFSRSDSPLNDDFTQEEFSAFILQLKRVKTPVEFSDSMEESLSEMDELLDQVQLFSSTPPTLLVHPSVQLSEHSSQKISAPSCDVLKPSMVSSLSSSMLNISAASAPNIGPFLTTLLHKLECLMQNSLYVNLLLTGLICRLACYSHPLLRSFLLNHSLVFQPSVKSLVQVLGSVKHKIDAYAFTVKDFDNLLSKARRFLAWREDVFLHGNETGRPRSDSTLSLPGKVKQNPPKERKRTKAIGDFFFGRKNARPPATPASRLQLLSDNKGFRYFNVRGARPGQDLADPMEAVRTKNSVYCALVLEEFLKELSAVAQEHSIMAEDC